MTQHIGIVACSAEGAQQLGPHAHPEVSMHTPSLAGYMECIYRDDWQGVGELMLASAEKLARIGAYFQQVIGRMKGEGCDAVVLGCTEIPLIMNDANSPLPTLDSTRGVSQALQCRARAAPTVAAIPETLMLTLHGSPISNYYNKVKLALLEKGVPFTEAYTATHSTDEAVLGASPLAKIPFITTERGCLCESQPILEWIEATLPQPPLLPADAFAAAKVRELTTFLDWHLEIVARQLYGPAFFGGAAMSEANAARIRKQLVNNIAAFKRLAKFAPYVAGDTFTQADCAAFNHLPLVAMASKAIYGEDLLQAGGIDHKAYTRFIGERASAQKVVADRKAAPKM